MYNFNRFSIESIAATTILTMQYLYICNQYVQLVFTLQINEMSTLEVRLHILFEHRLECVSSILLQVLWRLSMKRIKILLHLSQYFKEPRYYWKPLVKMNAYCGWMLLEEVSIDIIEYTTDYKTLCNFWNTILKQ